MPRGCRAQAWGIDLMVAVIIFTIGIVVFYFYALNQPNEAEETMDALFYDGRIIADSILSEGHPKDWSASNAVTLGILSGNKINETKLERLYTLTNTDYSRTKSLFNTRYDYFMFFLDEDGVIVFGGCGIGNQEITTVDSSLAYYYSQTADMHMLDEMQDLEADIYCDNKVDCDPNNLAAFLGNINDYYFILMEDPHLDKPDNIGYSDDEKKQVIENYVSNGGKLFITEHIKIDMLGAEFGNNGDNPATIIKDDEYLPFSIGETIEIKQKPSITNLTDVNYEVIANYSDGKTAISKWDYGGGFVYFFSDIELESGTIEDEVEQAVTSILTGGCIIDANNIESENLIKITRFTIYKNKPVTAYLYVWE